jgi:hypothetical protein
MIDDAMLDAESGFASRRSAHAYRSEIDSLASDSRAVCSSRWHLAETYRGKGSNLTFASSNIRKAMTF